MLCEKKSADLESRSTGELTNAELRLLGGPLCSLLLASLKTFQTSNGNITLNSWCIKYANLHPVSGSANVYDVICCLFFIFYLFPAGFVLHLRGCRSEQPITDESLKTRENPVNKAAQLLPSQHSNQHSCKRLISNQPLTCRGLRAAALMAE